MTQKHNKRPSANSARPARSTSATAPSRNSSSQGPRGPGAGKPRDARRGEARYEQNDRPERGERGEREERSQRGPQRDSASWGDRPARGDQPARPAAPRQGERRSDSGSRPPRPPRSSAPQGSPRRPAPAAAEPVAVPTAHDSELQAEPSTVDGSSPEAPVRPAKPKAPPAPRATMHPDNPHLAGYDFDALCECRASLKKHLITAPNGQPTIDFSKPAAVKSLNRALLALHYGVQGWDLPTGYLCPPVPGRLDYLLHLADLLAGENDGEPPLGASIRALDVGVGANVIYPLLGQAHLGWRFVGIDIDPVALANAQQIIDANPQLEGSIELRQQAVPENIFTGALRGGEKFDISLCNPPFHRSLAEAEEGSRRKWNQLGKPKAAGSATQSPLLNFGGQVDELCCPGGELGFVQTMIEQSAGIPKRCLWFTTLLAKEANLPLIEKALKKARVADFRIIPMGQGQKQSRIVAWTFTHPAERQRWRRERWAGLGG